MSLCVIHTPISWNYGHPKPTFVFLGCPLLFDNMFVCPRSAPFDSLSFSMLSFYLFPLSLHVHAWSMDTWSKGATSQAQAKRAWMQTRRVRMQAHKEQCSVDQEAQPPRVVIYFSLSLSLLSRALYQGSPSPCTLYLSCTLLGYTLRTLAMSIYFRTLCDSILHDA